MKYLCDIARSFALEGEVLDIKTLGAGFINDTYVVSTSAKRYILQRKNHNIFPDVPAMMDNIARDITKFLAHVRVQIEVKPREEKQEQYQTNQGEDQSLVRKPTKVDPNKKLGPNDPCYCGSGKKFKYCCGARR